MIPPKHDYCLTLSASPEGRSCRLLLQDQRGGILAEEIVPSLEDEGLEACLRLLRVFVEEPVAAGVLESLGRQLARRLLPPPVRDRLWAELSRDPDPTTPVRLRLRVESADLAAAPWEFLYIDAAPLPGFPGFLGLHPRFHLIRQATAPIPVAPIPADPLRVLIAWADPRSARYPALIHLATEVNSVLAALRQPECRRVVVEELRYATPAALQRHLEERPPHILHFIGHGDQRATGGVLVVHGDQPGTEAIVYGDDLARWLQKKSVRLVVLSACGTAMPMGGVAQALVRTGVPAVVAMQLPLRDATAELFARAFYSALSEPRSVEEALAGARRALRGAGPDWGVPVLYLGGDTGDVFGASAGSRNPRPPSGGGAQVVLLYRRGVGPDAYVLDLLETGLAARGYRVFTDRHMSPGVRWAEEIERRIRTADALIPLISEASLGSDMLEQEVRIGCQAAQQGRGLPRLLPVRVDYPHDLYGPLADMLERAPCALWSSPQDDHRLVEELVQALETRAEPEPAPRPDLEPVGGAVPLDSKFYIVRPADELFREAVARQDSIVLVKGPRQIGKTSLLARGIQQARQQGARVILTDFQKLTPAHLESAEALFLALARSVADRLDLETAPDDIWSPRRSANINFERYLEREVLGKVPFPLVWGMDEVDRLFPCDFSSEVFALFRAWHNERSLDPTRPWGRLTLAIAYATEAHLFITDLNQSPFNVGTRLRLEDFTLEQVAALNRRYGCPVKEADLPRYFDLVGGNPYLVRRGFYEIAARGLDMATFEARAPRDEGPFGDHLRRILLSIARDPDLQELMRGLLRNRACPASENFYRLLAAGVLAGDSAAEARPRCRLYRTYLEEHLV